MGSLQWPGDPFPNDDNHQPQAEPPPPPPSPYGTGQAGALGAQEQALLGRQAPAISAVDPSGLAASRGNQMQALGAQQAIMNGPSLAQMQGQQAFGAARQQMGGAAAGNPLAMRQAMMGGNQQLGAMAGGMGSSMGQENLERQQGIAQGVNALGQGDISSQNAMQQLAQQQQQLYLNQRKENLGQAQGYEQNYTNVQTAYEQKAQADLARQQALEQAKQQQGTDVFGDIMKGVSVAAAML